MTIEQTDAPLELTEESTARMVKTPNWNFKIYEAGEGHPLIMLHGSGPGATGWSNFGPNIKYLARRFRCIAVDQIGWGGSDAAENPRQYHVDSLLELMDTLGIEKAALLGNSMGGGVAVRTVSQAPERVSHLVTMGAGLAVPGVPPIIEMPGASEGLKALQNAYRNPSFESMTGLVRAMTYDPKFVQAELVQQRLDAALARPEHLENFINQLPDSGSGLNANGVSMFADPHRLAKSGVPAMIVVGRNDRVSGLENSLRLVTTMPGAYLAMFGQCGHWAQLEHADRFNRLVEDFISNE